MNTVKRRINEENWDRFTGHKRGIDGRVRSCFCSSHFFYAFQNKNRSQYLKWSRNEAGDSSLSPPGRGELATPSTHLAPIIHEEWICSWICLSLAPRRGRGGEGWRGVSQQLCGPQCTGRSKRPGSTSGLYRNGVGGNGIFISSTEMGRKNRVPGLFL